MKQPSGLESGRADPTSYAPYSNQEGESTRFFSEVILNPVKLTMVLIMPLSPPDIQITRAKSKFATTP